MNPILAFGLFALLIIAGAAMVLYGILQRPKKKESMGEECTVVIDDRLKPIVLDFQEPDLSSSECSLDREPECTPTQEADLPDSPAADAFSRLNEKFRRMKELEAEEKKKMQQAAQQELQAEGAGSTSPEEPEIDSNEAKKVLPDQPEQKGVPEQKEA